MESALSDGDDGSSVECVGNRVEDEARGNSVEDDGIGSRLTKVEEEVAQIKQFYLILPQSVVFLPLSQMFLL